jgi:hypothetical protein
VSIQKKSLISTLKSAKKANVAKEDVTVSGAIVSPVKASARPVVARGTKASARPVVARGTKASARPVVARGTKASARPVVARGAKSPRIMV